MKGFLEHAKHAGSEILQDRVDIVSKLGEDHFEVKTIGGKNFDAKRIILATGNEYKMLGVSGEKEFYGQGVSYCATCDGNFYKNLTVAVIGAGNTAITEALYLAEIAKEVHILVRSDLIRAEDIWVEKAKSKDNIIIHLNTQATEVIGSMMGVTGLSLQDNTILPLDGVFVAIGSTPFTKIVDTLHPEKDGE